MTDRKRCFELVTWDSILGSATANLISGRPDCHDHVSWHTSPTAAIRALKRHPGARLRVDGQVIMHGSEACDQSVKDLAETIMDRCGETGVGV